MRSAALCVFLLSACAHSPELAPSTQPALSAVAGDTAPVPPGPKGSFTLSIVETNDAHGHLTGVDGKGGMPLLGGYVTNLRTARARDGGGVVLLDVGDAFQGTLDSNLDQGESVIRAYEVLGYDAMAVGNHELDFGQPALEARAKQATFPLLTANLLAEGSEWPPAWAKKSKLIHVAGVKVGIIGVTTIDTPITTAVMNMRGLRILPLAPAIVDQAASLRKRGATVILVAAHAGAKCTDITKTDDVSSCDDGEVFKLARALPPGTVDAILAGHTHQPLAHRVNGIPIVQAFANSVALGRIDLTIDRATGRATGSRIFAPQELVPGDYEGAPVVADARVEAAIAPALEHAKSLREEPLGWVLPAPLKSGYDTESELGDALVDLLLLSHPEADVAVINSGGLHADLPAGPLTYGKLFETYPFDNHIAHVKLNGGQMKRVVLRTLHGHLGILLIAGIHAEAECKPSGLEITLTRPDGRAIRDSEPLNVVTTDFLVGNGDDFALAQLGLPKGAITIDEGELMRDGIARVLRTKGADPHLKLFDGKARHIGYPGKRPVACH